MAVVESPNPFDATSSAWDGVGWFCMKEVASTPLEVCHRTKKYCERIRSEHNRRTGVVVEPCVFRKSATCLLVKMDGVERAVPFCHVTKEECEDMRASLRSKPRNFVSDCKTLD